MKNTYKLILMILIGTASHLSFANVQQLQQQENQVLQKFKQQHFYEVNGDIESAVVEIISNDKNSFNYDFPALVKQGYVHVQYSPDKKLKFYSFDVSGGGTMGEWDSYVQYYTGQTQHFDEFSAGWINQIQPVRIQNKVVYLVRSYYKGDSCTGMHQVRAVEVGPKQLLKSYIFQNKYKQLDEISVDYDCHDDIDRSASQHYLKVGPKHVDVMLLNAQYQPQNKYLRYTLGSKGFVYQGIVK